MIRSDYSLQSSMLIRNLQNDKSVITLDSFDKFDFAVKLEYLMDKNIPLQGSLDQYVDMRITHNNYYWELNETSQRTELIKEKRNFDVVDCKEPRLNTTKTHTDAWGHKNHDYLGIRT